MIGHIIIIALSMYVTGSTHFHNAGFGIPNVFVCKSGMESPPEEDFSISSLSTRSFLLNRTMHWRGGVVPYTMDKRFTYHQIWVILRAIKMFSHVSCVRWVPWTHGHDRVNFIWNEKRDVCESIVGHRGGAQSVQLGDNCFLYDKGYPGAVEHEMMHALGFVHEHQRLDRNCYVRINAIAISGSPVDFAIIDDTDTSFPYDFNSIMHYGTPNITAYSGRQMGNVKGVLTDMDVLKLNYLYCGGLTFCQKFPLDCNGFEKLRNLCKLRTSARLRRPGRRNQRNHRTLHFW